MNRMEIIFDQMKAAGEKVLILYFPIGDPAMGDSVAWGEKYFDNGATVLEIGLPYEDPVLDGPVVKDSMGRAIARVSMDEVFGMIAEIRRRRPDNILQVMTYYGNIAKLGTAGFAEKCAMAGVDAVLTPDASIEQLHELDEVLGRYGIHNLRFAPYHLNEEFIGDLQAHAAGYIFQQAVDGGTGMQATVSPQIGINVKRIKEAGIQTPVCAGFGISSAEQAAEALSMGADGIIVGSAMIKHLLNGDGENYIRSLRAVMKQ